MKSIDLTNGLISFLIIVLAGCFFTSCEKSPIVPTVTEEVPAPTTTIALDDVKVQDGMLVFKSQEHLYTTINTFAAMSADDRMAWGEQNQVKTQRIILDEITEAQIAFEAEYYQGIEPGLSLEELQRAGVPVEVCDLYKEYLQKGIITQVQEEDGFYSYHLSLQSPSLVFIANEQGNYIVNDSIYLRTNNFLALKKYEGKADIELLQRADQIESDAIIYFDFSEQNRTTHSFYYDSIFGSHGTLSDPTWYYDSGKERFKHYVDFQSSISGSLTFMTSEFYTEALAQKKTLWFWHTSNNYNPIDYINGSWQYFWIRLNWNTSQGTYFYNNLSGGNNSPFMLNPPGTTNLLGASLNPSGVYSLTLPYAFDIPVWIYNMHIHGFFPGSTGSS